MKNLLVALFCLMILCSFNTSVSHDPDEQEKSLIKKEIETIVHDFFNPETLNYATHTGLRANREGYLMAGDGKIMFTDYPSYQAQMKLSFGNMQRFTEAKADRTYTYVLAKDAAACTTEFQSKYLTNKGDTIVNNGCWTFVFKKFDGQWKVIQENGTHTK